jgi:hypothetical protein
MNKIDLVDATKPLAEYVKEMDGMSLVIVYKGVALAALVPLENADYETVTMATDPEFRAILERSRKSLREEGGVPAEEVRKMFLEDDTAPGN